MSLAIDPDLPFVEKTCCFSGHRQLPASAAEALPRVLTARIAALIAEGYVHFLCGGALGFDMLAAEAVLSERIRLPGITLSLALPYPEQSAAWSDAVRSRYGRILRLADEVICLSPVFYPFCLQQRNRFMVEKSDLLCCYLTADRGGTAGTVAYALRCGVPVVNLALEL